MCSENFQVIFNPASAGGKTGHKKEFLQILLSKYLNGNYDFHETSFKGHAKDITRQLCSEGYINFIVIGGDGTIQETVNGLFSKGKIINPLCRVGIISSGTGQGFAKSFDIPSELDKQFNVIKNGNTRYTDLGRIRFGLNGTSKDVIFINEFQAGIGSSVVQSVQGKQKKMGGTLAYGIKTISKVFSQPNQQMNISFEGKSFDTRLFGLVVANGAFTGGSMNLVPAADPSDNLLDILIMHAQGAVGRLQSFPKIYSGRHLLSKHFSSYRVSSLSLSSVIETITEADGEILYPLPCTIDVIPSALKIFSS